MKKLLMLIAAMMVFAPAAEAKRFFDFPLKYKVTYSNILTGTKTVFEGRAGNLRYANDWRNCLVFKDGVISQTASSACRVVQYYRDYAVFALPAAALEFMVEDKLPAELVPAFRRIVRHANYIQGSLYFTKPDSIESQLHDGQANESFHIYIWSEAEKEL